MTIEDGHVVVSVWRESDIPTVTYVFPEQAKNRNEAIDHMLDNTTPNDLRELRYMRAIKVSSIVVGWPPQ